MSKAGHFARPVGVDGKHQPPSARKEEEASSRWSETVHKVADTLREWLPSSEKPKEG